MQWLQQMRLGKYLAHAGVASRRAAERVIADGRVTVDGELVTDPARDVGDQSVVVLDGRPLAGPERRVVYALNKPVGVVSTARDTHGRRTVLDLMPSHGLRLYPIGRLDAQSSGLILLSNDGELANRLTHPSFQVPKTYRVKVGGSRVALEDGLTAPAGARRLAAHALEITIREGRKHQVRRMCAAVGHPVVELQRVAFGPLRLGALEPSQHRLLSAAEIERLRAL